MASSDVTPTQIRIPDDIKRAAKKRAIDDNTNLSHAVVRFLEAYGAGRADLPDPPPDEQG